VKVKAGAEAPAVWSRGSVQEHCLSSRDAWKRLDLNASAAHHLHYVAAREAVAHKDASPRQFAVELADVDKQGPLPVVVLDLV
jgi:hypothetical protein